MNGTGKGLMQAASLSRRGSWLGTAFSMMSGAAAACKILALSLRATAILSTNDKMAIGALRTLYKADVAVPGEMAVTGFDDVRYAAHSAPPLTTVALPAREMGGVARNLLMDLIEGKASREDRSVLPHQLVLRESAG